MIRATLPLVCSLCLFLFGCGDSSTGPDTPPVDDYTLEEETTIGPDGGSLQTDDFTLDVPAGAFASSTDLALYSSTEDEPFGDHGASKCYRLEGLPDDYALPLSLRIQCEDLLAESTFVAMGADAMIAETGETECVYQMLSGEENAGFFGCDLSVPETGAASAVGPRTLSAQETGYRTFVIVSRYKFYYGVRLGNLPIKYTVFVPTGTEISITTLAELLDGAYGTFLDMGYRPVFTTSSFDPVIIARRWGANTTDYCRFAYDQKNNYALLEVNADKMSAAELPKMKIAIGRAVYRTVLFSYPYDPDYPVMKSPADRPHEWLIHATVAWAGELFVPEAQRNTYVPSDLLINEYRPFFGMQAGITAGFGSEVANARYHGYAMAAMIEYLANWLDPGNPTYPIARAIHEGLGTRPGPPEHPVVAVATANTGAQGLPKYWWWIFMDSYVRGLIYGVDWESLVDAKAVDGVFAIGADDDTLKTWADPYPDLSARRYLIDLNHPNIAENTTMELKLVNTTVAAEDLKILVYKLVGSTLTHISVGNLRTEISDIRQLTDEFADLVVMVVNSSYHAPTYDLESDITLQMRLTGTKELSYTGCTVYYGVDGNFRDSDGLEYIGWSSNQFMAEGSFAGSVFSGSWSIPMHGSDAVGGIVVYMNATASQVDSVVVDYMLTSFGITYSTVLSAENLPYVQKSSEGWMEFGVDGSAVQQYIKTLSDRVASSGGYWSGFDTFTTGEDAYITLRFF